MPLLRVLLLVDLAQSLRRQRDDLEGARAHVERIGDVLGRRGRLWYRRTARLLRCIRRLHHGLQIVIIDLLINAV